MKELSQKNTKELTTLLSEKQTALRTFRFGIAGSNLRNVREGRAIKKDIARIQTMQNSAPVAEVAPKNKVA